MAKVTLPATSTIFKATTTSNGGTTTPSKQKSPNKSSSSSSKKKNKKKHHSKKQQHDDNNSNKTMEEEQQNSTTTMNHQTTTGTILKELQMNLELDNIFFDNLVDMIPKKLYIAEQNNDNFNPKYFKGQAKESKERRRAQSKQAKRMKLDPKQAETTTQMKQRLELEKQQEQQEQDGNNNTKQPQQQQEQQQKNSNKTSTTSNSNNNNNNNNKSRIEALREKLHAKIAEKRGQRPTDPNVVSKRAARRAEKVRRKEEAIAKNKKKSHTATGKEKNVTFISNSINPIDSTTTRTITQDLQNLDFGRLDGLNPSNIGNTKVALTNLSKTKNLEKMLKDAEKKKQRLEELKQLQKEQQLQSEDDDDNNKNKIDAKKQIESIQWGDAIKEASGERVKDDPNKIKKVLKRKAAKKAKSAKAWKTRLEQTKTKMDERQKIRTHNLKTRTIGGSAGANLSKKRIVDDDTTKNDGDKKKDNNNKTTRKQRRPGFEGKKQEFLNHKKHQ